MYARALAVLREVHIILKEDLRDIDLLALHNDTQTAFSDSATRERWTRVLTSVAPTLMLMKSELRNADSYIDMRKRSMKSFMNMIMVFSQIIIMVFLHLFTTSMKDSMSVTKLASIAIASLMLTLVITCVIKSIMLTFNERMRSYMYEINGTTKMAVQYYCDEICDHPLVKLSAAHLTGVGMSDIITGDSSSGDGRRGSVQESVTRLLDCSTTKQRIPSVAKMVEKACGPSLAGVAIALQEIKDEYDRYDRLVIWSRIETGFNTLVRFVSKEGDTERVKISPSTVREVIIDEIIPLLVPPMLEIDSLEPVPALANNAQALIDALAPYAYSTTLVGAKGLAWRSCFGDTQCRAAVFVPLPRSKDQKPHSRSMGWLVKLNSLLFVERVYVFKRQDASKIRPGAPPPSSLLVRKVPRDEMGTSVFVTGSLPESYLTSKTAGLSMRTLQRRKSTAEAIEFCRGDEECALVYDDYVWGVTGEARPSDFRTFFGSFTVAGGDTLNMKDVRVKVEAHTLYADALTSTDAGGAMLFSQKDALASDMAGVLHKYDFRLNLSEHRRVIEQLLVAEYTYDIFYKSSRAAANAVVRLAEEKVIEIHRSHAVKYVSTSAMVDRVARMNDLEWMKFNRIINEVVLRTRQYRIVFPFYKELVGIAIRESILNYTIPIFLLALFLIYTLVISLYGVGTLQSKSDTIMSAIVVTCVTILFITIFELMLKKKVALVQRKNDIVEQNGTEFVGNLMRAIRMLGTVRANASDRGDRRRALEASSAVIRSVDESIKNFERCNYINVDNVSAPFPVAEVGMFLIVVFIFVAVAVIVSSALDPITCRDNIGRLGAFKKMVNNGEIDKSMFDDAFSSSVCLTPPMPPIIMGKIISVVCMVMVTIWFIDANFVMEKDMMNVVSGIRDCREVDEY
eukprot:gene28557-31717_t